MLRIRRENNRKPPSAWAGIEPSADDEARHQRKIADDLREDLREVADSLSGDARDEVDVTSAGEDEEVAVTHDLGITPERWRLVDKDGAGDIWRSKDHQWSDRTAYFKTSAEAGVVFRVVLFQKPSGKT